MPRGAVQGGYTGSDYTMVECTKEQYTDEILANAKEYSDTTLATAQAYTDNAVAQKSAVQIITWGADD